MIEGFRRTFNGSNPYYEVWYGKVDIAPGQAYWFRYTLLNGEISECSTWAILFDGDDVTGDREVWDLDNLAEGNTQIIPTTKNIERFRDKTQVFHLGECHLDESNALGFAGELEWDLSWEDSGRQLQYAPRFLETIGLAKSNYYTCFLDLDVSGTVSSASETYNVENASGMIGHIYGTKISGKEWGWSHCNSFDDHDDAVFEGLSARIETPLFTTPTLTGLHLIVDGEEYSFLSPMSIFRADSTFDRYGWTFESDSGDAHIKGEATAPENVALVEYTDTDASKLWCYNSKLATLNLTLTDKDNGNRYELRSSGRAAYEWVTRDEPSEEILVD